MPIHNQKTIRLTMAQAVVKYLQVQYSERDGHNRRLATLACTASVGPGSTNMVTGAATATVNRLPVLLLASDIYATCYQGPVLQQLEHPISGDVSVNDCFRPVSRFFDRISRPEQLLTALPEAMRVLTDPADTGAVTLALPQDIQAHAYEYPLRLFEPRTWSIERRLPNPQRIAEAIKLIKAAERPMIIAGGGVIYAEAEGELLAVAQKFGIPVGETFAGKGAMPEETPLTLGGFGVTGIGSAGELMHKADLVIAIGTRLTDFTTGSQSAFNHPDVKFISINVNGHDAYKPGLGVRLAQPAGEVYVLVGDGTYLMQPTELVTAMKEGLKITVLVMNNHGFQIIRRLQMGRMGISFGNEFRARDKAVNRLEGDYVTIDFAKNAESMGARAWNVQTPEELRQALPP